MAMNYFVNLKLFLFDSFPCWNLKKNEIVDATSRELLLNSIFIRCILLADTKRLHSG